MHSGKMLGGSSGLNIMGWGRASSTEYDALDAFAPNAGWTWSGLLPYLKKVETFAAEPRNTYPGISEEQVKQAEANAPVFRGSDGPIVVRTQFTRSSIQSAAHLTVLAPVGIVQPCVL